MPTPTSEKHVFAGNENKTNEVRVQNDVMDKKLVLWKEYVRHCHLKTRTVFSNINPYPMTSFHSAGQVSAEVGSFELVNYF